MVLKGWTIENMGGNGICFLRDCKIAGDGEEDQKISFV
jgi:hypothetical protein